MRAHPEDRSHHRAFAIDEAQLPDVDELVARWLTSEGPMLRAMVVA